MIGQYSHVVSFSLSGALCRFMRDARNVHAHSEIKMTINRFYSLLRFNLLCLQALDPPSIDPAPKVTRAGRKTKTPAHLLNYFWIYVADIPPMMSTPPTITCFKGPHNALSNFYEFRFTWLGHDCAQMTFSLSLVRSNRTKPPEDELNDNYR